MESLELDQIFSLNKGGRQKKTRLFWGQVPYQGSIPLPLKMFFLKTKCKKNHMLRTIFLKHHTCPTTDSNEIFLKKEEKKFAFVR